MHVMLARWLCVRHQKLPEWADGTKWPYAVVSDCGIALWHLIVASHCDIALMLTLWLCGAAQEAARVGGVTLWHCTDFFLALWLCVQRQKLPELVDGTKWPYAVASHCGITLWHCTDVNPLALCAAQEAAGVGGWDQVA